MTGPKVESGKVEHGEERKDLPEGKKQKNPGLAEAGEDVTGVEAEEETKKEETKED